MEKIYSFILVFAWCNISYSQKDTLYDSFADTIFIANSHTLIGNIISQGTCDDTVLLAMQLKDNTFFVVLNNDIYDNDIDSIFWDIVSDSDFSCIHIDYPCVDLFINKNFDSILFPHACRFDYKINNASVASFFYPNNRYPILQKKLLFFYRYSYPLIEYDSNDTTCIKFTFSNINNICNISLGDLNNLWVFLFKKELNFLFQYSDSYFSEKYICIYHEL